MISLSGKGLNEIIYFSRNLFKCRKSSPKKFLLHVSYTISPKNIFFTTGFIFRFSHISSTII